ncbi:ATP-dependent DNA helicase sgs1 [Puccinia graminis f. sp. tritici]|uniref:DNA 3'-5' helicase n=1 Tax=Puccinia graminis f. sp. tritici TaxID=56615 RepID=A0A5B0R7X5_PUCGR|nr:ATP-dependent DNA helicase sgs1 [Puccinia graminis f. sp. tritici]
MLNQISSRTISPQPRRVWTSTGINVYKKIYEKNDTDLKTHIEKVSLDFYGQPSKPRQTEAVINLVKGRNTFLLAGTGFGKSRIAELYYKMIPQNKRAVVLVLNPLDSLGDNQVYEKIQAGFTAINLTKMNFNEQIANEILNGVYQFVYMSPETYLNNKIWEAVYFSSKFQNRLALIVVDEAHMIYIWGLVASGHGKKAAAILLRFQDIGIFRPCYGNLGGHLLFRNDKPILLLSATCRPVAVEAIKKSLKLDDGSIDILKAELTRPEIRLVRIEMDKSLASSLDLLKVFPSAKDVENSDRSRDRRSSGLGR